MKLTDIVGFLLEQVLVLFRKYILGNKLKKLENKVIEEKKQSEKAVDNFLSSANVFEQKHSEYRMRRASGTMLPSRAESPNSSDRAAASDRSAGSDNPDSKRNN